MTATEPLGARASGLQITRRRLLLGALGGAAATLLPLRPSAVWSSSAAEVTQAREVLANGLVVIVEERPSADTVALQLAARAGSRDDGAQLGLTLLTSRTMFQGTSRRPSETDLQRAAALVGGTLTRGTTVESSFFTSVVPSREVEVAFDLVSDVVLDPLFDPDAIGRQKRIALQEIAQRRANPFALLDQLFQAEMFASHPAATPVLGTAESVEAVTREALLASRSQLWSAANLALVVVGRIRVEDALELAASYFGDLPQGSTNQRAPAQARRIESTRTVRGQAGQQQLQFRLGFSAPALRDDDRFPFTVLNALMAEPSGRLFRELRGARGLAYSAGSAYITYTDSGAWFAAAGVDPENLQPALEVVNAEVQRLRDAPPDPEEGRAKITEIAGRQVLADETNAARAGRLASREILGLETTEDFVQRIAEVTAADVHRVARTYLDPDRALVVIVGPTG